MPSLVVGASCCEQVGPELEANSRSWTQWLLGGPASRRRAASKGFRSSRPLKSSDSQHNHQQSSAPWTIPMPSLLKPENICE
jgi:hypothetical protein